MNPLDLGVLLVYLVGVTTWGAWLGRGQTGGRDYFLGSRNLPWWAVMLSVVATETSTLTFLSIPGVAYLGSLVFLQLTLGYLVGRIVVAAVLLPSYRRGELVTAYELLEARFGVGTRRLTSIIFMITRLLADSVRLFATAIPLALLTGWGYPASVAVIGALTVVYTYFGGIKAVVWVDVAQMGLYLLGAVAAAVALQGLVTGGWGAVLGDAAQAGKLQVFDFSFDPGVAYTFWAGLVGGAFLSMGSHGADQLIVQRLLTCRDLRASQRALVGSGVLVIVQFAVFLLVGLGLWAFYQGRPFEASDEIFARFIIEELPAGLTGLLVAGVLAAAMSSLSSSINALASATTYDLWAPLANAHADDSGVLRVGRLFTLLWSVLLVGGALAFMQVGQGATAVEVALGIASLVYGGLLGAFALAIFSRRADARSVAVGMVVGIGVVTWIWATRRAVLAWPWYVLVGTALTAATGWALGRGGSPRARSGPARGGVVLLVCSGLLGVGAVGSCDTASGPDDGNPDPDAVELAWFGYAAVACDHDDPHDAHVRTDYSSEVADFTNANQICVTSDFAALEERLRSSAALYRPIFYVEPVFFTQVGSSVAANPDADALWAEVRGAVERSDIDPADLVFYVADEPTLRGIDMADLESAAGRIAADFPSSLFMLVEAYDTAPPSIPDFVDWWGFNAYTLRDPGAVSWYTAHLDAAARGLRPHQALVVIADGIYTPVHAAQGLAPGDMAEVIRNYHTMAEARSDVVAMLVYAWPGGIDNSQELGTRDLPAAVIEAHRAVGRAIRSSRR